MPALEQRLLTHVRYLSEAIGPRPAGSPGNHAAADYIATRFATAGLTVERQEFSCPAWECRGTELSLDGAPLSAVANTFSPPCDARAQTLPLGTLAALESADIAGRIVVLYGELAVPLPAKAAPAQDERGARVVAALEAGRPAAVITVQPGEAILPRMIEDADLSIPSATVPARIGLELLRRPGAPARLRIFSTGRIGTSANIIGRQPGVAGRILLCAHYDTKIDTPGATDNAGGVAVLIELARALAARPRPPAVELAALSGEEYPLPDSLAYLRTAGRWRDTMAMALSFDGVGQALGATGISLRPGSPELEPLLRATVGHYPQIAWSTPPADYRRSRAALGDLPVAVLSSLGGARLAHTRDDTAQWIDPGRLAEALTLGLEIVEIAESYGRGARCAAELSLAV